MILTSWFTRGHWRETWATLALTTWYTIGLYWLIQLAAWAAAHIPTSNWNPNG